MTDQKRLPPKLAGGTSLDCGHQQVLPAYRLALSAAGKEQPLVWCVDCNDWTRLAPNSATVEQAEREYELESRWRFANEKNPEDDTN